MLVGRKDVILLAAIGPMEVPDQPQLLEDVERSVHGRRCRGRVNAPAALDELRSGHVPLGCGERIDDGSALRRRPQSAGPEAVADVTPRGDA